MRQSSLARLLVTKTMLQLAVAKLFLIAGKIFTSQLGKNTKTNVKSHFQNSNLNVLVEPEMLMLVLRLDWSLHCLSKEILMSQLALLWGSDHLFAQEDLFRQALKNSRGTYQKRCTGSFLSDKSHDSQVKIWIY